MKRAKNCEKAIMPGRSDVSWLLQLQGSVITHSFYESPEHSGMHATLSADETGHSEPLHILDPRPDPKVKRPEPLQPAQARMAW